MSSHDFLFLLFCGAMFILVAGLSQVGFVILIEVLMDRHMGREDRRSDKRRQRKEMRARRCKIDQEYGGIFIGRSHCHTHNVVWDDRGACPRKGQATEQPFAFVRDIEGTREGGRF